MTLVEYFNKLESHPLKMIKEEFKKVKKNKENYNHCVDFLSSIDGLDFDERQMKINRMFMDKEKPKLWRNMQELVQMAHSTKGK